jgi:hypothetical protein
MSHTNSLFPPTNNAQMQWFNPFCNPFMAAAALNAMNNPFSMYPHSFLPNVNQLSMLAQNRSAPNKRDSFKMSSLLGNNTRTESVIKHEMKRTLSPPTKKPSPNGNFSTSTPTSSPKSSVEENPSKLENTNSDDRNESRSSNNDSPHSRSSSSARVLPHATRISLLSAVSVCLLRHIQHKTPGSTINSIVK